MNDHNKKIIESVAWSAILRPINLISGLLLSIFLARELGPKVYGLFLTYVALIEFLIIITDFGMTSIASRYIAENKYGRALKSHLLRVGLLLIFVAAFLLGFRPEMDGIEEALSFDWALIILFIIFITKFFSFSIKGILMGMIKGDHVSKVELIVSIAKLLLFYIILSFNNEFEYLLLILLVVNSLELISYLRRIESKDIKFLGAYKEVQISDKEYTKFVFVTFFLKLFQYTETRAFIIIILSFMGHSASVAYVAIAYQILTSLNSVINLMKSKK